ncbi:MAG TPA: 3-methyl-2-oxobutanoate hydroxymethyltransferase [Steroidobacteraceae bacterium]|nr:3-methyl-2-oxobutanoate hydroxymethyltransferase [Steroidobacteraceae bacterium]
MSVHESGSSRRRVTTARLAEMKSRRERIAMLTAYDYSTARILDEAGLDVLLVGDSASNVMHGHETTLPITLDQMIVHASAVVRAARSALIVVDMPFGSYQGDSRLALESAVRIMKESGAHAVKMEGGEVIIESVRRVISAGIPVMGHLGLTPQSIYRFGSYVVRATAADEAERLAKDALLLERSGCFALVIEKIPASLGARIARELTIPAIGIGAGPGLDGQVLVTHDLLGITTDFSPRFIRRYAALGEVMTEAFRRYIGDVKSGAFPSEDESY